MSLLSPGVQVTELSVPYVYRADNNVTGEFYFGYRTRHIKNRTPINEDLGVSYFSSCNYINENKEDFSFCTILVCSTKKEAYCYEQRMIKSYWNDENC